MGHGDLLAGLSIFRHLKKEQMDKVADLAEVRVCREGEALFEENDAGDGLYVIESGVVDIVKRALGGGETHLARLRDGEVVGELSLFDDGPRSATARAVIYPETTMLFLARDGIHRLIDEDAELARTLLLAIVRKVALRLRQADDALRGAGETLYYAGNAGLQE